MMGFIVCDNHDLASQLRSALAKIGYDCPDANLCSDESAVRILGGLLDSPDVVLCGLTKSLPECDRFLQELRAQTRSYLVAVGPRDLQFVLMSVRAGCDDYVDESADFAGELAELVERAGPAMRRGNSPGQLTTLIAAGGGNGCTTIAVNLAVMLAQRQERSLLLDLDLHGGCAASLLNLRPRHTFSDLIRNIDKLDRKMFEQSLARHDSGAELLASAETFDSSLVVKDEDVARLTRVAGLHCPRVIVDLKDFWSGAYKPLLRDSTRIVVVTRLDFPAISNANRAVDHLNRIGVPRDRMTLVVNRVGQPKELPPTDVACALKMKIEHFLPDDRKTINSCANCGTPAASAAPETKYISALAALADEIDGKAASSSKTPSTMTLMERATPFLGRLVRATNVRLDALIAKPTV